MRVSIGLTVMWLTMGVILCPRSEGIPRSERTKCVTGMMDEEESEFDSKFRSGVWICGKNPRWYCKIISVKYHQDLAIRKDQEF